MATDRTFTVGCCGWGYLREKEFSKFLKQKYTSKLQAYAQLFCCVEVNSTFYRIPKLTTAEKWRKEADEANKNFEFTVKASQVITHIDRFGSTKSVDAFEQMFTICQALRASVLLFQSPGSFLPSSQNIQRMRNFFGKIQRGNLHLVWEPRGKWWNNPQIVKDVCKEFHLICCVDPFRNEPLQIGRTSIGYFRLHGLGKPSMYWYTFSQQELHDLINVFSRLPKSIRHVYAMFNNVDMYQNGVQFSRLVYRA